MLSDCQTPQTLVLSRSSTRLERAGLDSSHGFGYSRNVFTMQSPMSNIQLVLRSVRLAQPSVLDSLDLYAACYAPLNGLN